MPLMRSSVRPEAGRAARTARTRKTAAAVSVPDEAGESGVFDRGMFSSSFPLFLSKPRRNAKKKGKKKGPG
jgi:hypothetical protein